MACFYLCGLAWWKLPVAWHKSKNLPENKELYLPLSNYFFVRWCFFFTTPVFVALSFPSTSWDYLSLRISLHAGNSKLPEEKSLRGHPRSATLAFRIFFFGIRRENKKNIETASYFCRVQWQRRQSIKWEWIKKKPP